MKKTIVKYECDDCFYTNDNCDGWYSINGFMLCQECTRARLEYSVALVPFDRRCQKCNGNKRVKDYYGYNNDYEYVQCSECKGTGVIEL